MKGSEIEKRVYLTYHGDGLADLALGLVLILFGTGMAYDVPLLTPIFASLAYPCWLLAKKGITQRRLGYVEFSGWRKRRERRGLVLLFVLGVLVLLVSVLGYAVFVREGTGGSLLATHGYLLLGVIFGLMSSSVGLVLDVIRFHVYSLIILAAVWTGHQLAWADAVGILVPGILVTGTGGLLMVVFLRKYCPREDAEIGRKGDVE